MGKRSIQDVRPRKLDKHKKVEGNNASQQAQTQGEQQKTERDDEENEISDHNYKQTVLPLSSKYGVCQGLTSRYLIRRYLVKILEERFPGQWSIMLHHDMWIIDLPEPLSSKDIQKCYDGSSSSDSTA